MKDRPWYQFVIGGVAILAVFYILYYKPKSNQLNGIKTERIQIEDEVVKLQAKKKELNKIESEIKTMTGTLTELEAIIPQKKEISSILRRIQELALNSRLTIENFTPKGEVDKEFYAEWPIPIQISGNYHNLGILFDRLSRFSRLFNVESFSIKALRSQTDAATISASFTAKTYIFREEVPAKPKRKRR